MVEPTPAKQSTVDTCFCVVQTREAGNLETAQARMLLYFKTGEVADAVYAAIFEACIEQKGQDEERCLN